MNEFEQGLLRYLSKEQLSLIQQLRIGIAGCGGLGSNIANVLTRSGFKYFELIDADTVDASNLNRQNYYLDEIGSAKVDLTAARMRRINPDINIKTIQEYLDQSNITAHFNDCDYLFEAFDNVQSKVLLLETFGNTGKTIVMGNGMSGSSNQPELRIRKLNSNVYLVGDGVTEASSDFPPLAPRVVACAALMASVVVDLVLSKK